MVARQHEPAAFSSERSFFAALSGTWWVGTGDKYHADNTVAVPAGSYVIHYTDKVHYDGVKMKKR